MESTAATLPAWDNSREFSSLEGSDLRSARSRLDELFKDFSLLAGEIEARLPEEGDSSREKWMALVEPSQRLSKLLLEVSILGMDLGTFAQTELSVDGSNQVARRLAADLQQFGADIEQAAVVLKRVELLMPSDVLLEYLKDPEVKNAEFLIVHSRAHLADTQLPIREEKLIAALSVNGIDAWSNQYDNIAGTATCEVQLASGTEKLGLAAAQGLLQNSDSTVRRAAWEGMQSTWRNHEESAASGLNAMIGWRFDVLRRRSHSRELHYLDAPLFQNRISKDTLNALMEALREEIEVGRRGLRAQAKALRLSALHPADLAAPLPPELAGGKGTSVSFARAVEAIRDSFAEVHAEMGDFVSTMVSERWIEARVLPKKRPGAYCTSFIRSRSPRVFMTYQEGMRDVKTLAHELGHALHEWLMRDLPLQQRSYPMTLAETASNFGEMVVGDYLERSAASEADIATGLWQAIQDGSAYLINLPSRFDLEREMNERRSKGVMTPDDLRSMTESAWQSWYGDTLSEPDPMFWASKLHFHMSGLSFYNFPYSFGYLFSLGVYAQRERLGKDFYNAYRSLLRDTGRMTAEEVAERHLGVDLRTPGFWKQSIGVYARKVAQFEAMVKARYA